MKKNRIVGYLCIILCAYASTSIMGITPPSINFYESIKTPGWIKNPTQQAYVQTLLNRMPQRLSVFARKNPYTAALIAAILSSGGIYGGYTGLKWAWKSPRKAPTPPQPEKRVPEPVEEPDANPPSAANQPPIKSKSAFRKGYLPFLEKSEKEISDKFEELRSKSLRKKKPKDMQIELAGKFARITQIKNDLEAFIAQAKILSPTRNTDRDVIYTTLVTEKKRFEDAISDYLGLLDSISDEPA